MSYLNIVLDKPKGLKLCPTKSGVYVYHVLDSVYHPEKKYNIDTRVCIGKMVKGSIEKMIPNDKFELYYPELLAEARCVNEPPQFSQTIHAGAVIAEQEIAKNEGLTEILIDIYGSSIANEIIDLVTFIITDESAVFQHAPAFMRKHLQLGNAIRGDSYISSRLLHREITESRIIRMLRRWNELHRDIGKIYIGCDSTNFNTEAEDIRLAEFGKAKDDPTKPQVNLAVTVSQEDTTPLYYELFPGSIIDMSECERLMDQMYDLGYRDIGLLFDRGFCCEGNIRSLDERGYGFIMMLRDDLNFFKDLIHEQRDAIKDQPDKYLDGLDVFATTVKKMWYDKTRYFHVYYDEVVGSLRKQRFLSALGKIDRELSDLVGKKLRANMTYKKYAPWFDLDIDKDSNVLRSYKKRGERIRERLLMFGFFAIMTTEDMSAETALGIYRARDNIEKFFRSIKSGMDFDSPGVHDDEALAAKIHLMFLASIIRNRLTQASIRLKESTGNKKAFTVPSMIDMLEQIECTAYDDGIYQRRFALTAKQKQVLDALGIEHSVVDSKIMEFNARHSAESGF